MNTKKIKIITSSISEKPYHIQEQDEKFTEDIINKTVESMKNKKARDQRG